MSDVNRTAFIAASAGTPLTVLKDVLLKRGLTPVTTADFVIGADWLHQLTTTIRSADLVIGVLAPDRSGSGVMFELGQAFALHRRVVLVAPPGSGPLPFDVRSLPVVTASAEQRDALEFTIDLILAAPQTSARGPTPVTDARAAFGSDIGSLRKAAAHALATRDGLRFEMAVADTLRASGVEVVAASSQHDMGADLAVWADSLEPFVGNPLLIEVKTRLRDRAEIERVSQQLLGHLARTPGRWGAIIYGEGPPPGDIAWRSCPMNLLPLAFDDLLSAINGGSFPEFIRKLRNQRVHGT